MVPRVGDRFDTLAQKYYGDSTLWWIIAKANELSNGKLALDPNQKIRIPMNIDAILDSVRLSNV
jgi:nucleoid-associated protein YgaU